MKNLCCKIIWILMCSVITVNGLSAKDHNNIAFQKLLSRITSHQASNFKFEYIPDEKGKDVFELSYENSKIWLKGNNNNSLAVALNYYLKYFCYTNVSWYVNDSIQLPDVLPKFSQTIRHEAKVKNRFFLNYCTFGYTMPWWQWRDWERLIDWMALNGINMPLAITGQEAIWYKVWKQLGLTDMEIRTYFTGPAHLPWHRMSNIDKWQGALPMSYIDNQLNLQKMIVMREREFNMIPVLPAFSGHVPEILSTKFPKAKISELGEWSAFPEKYRSYFLDPFDPLFKKIQKLFLEEQARQFGTDHIYGTDPFNEVTPPSWEPSYLAEVSKTIYSSISAADPSGKWLMMTWIFYFQREHWTNARIQAFLKAVPQGKIMLLDYYGEDTEVWKFTKSYNGQPYIWCYLGNFGGNTMMVGNLSEVNKRMNNAFINGGANLEGVGSTLEGFNHNTIMYDYVFEKAWNVSDTSLREWVSNWAYSRVGKVDSSAARYWNLMVDSIYTSTAKLGQGVLTNSRPTLSGFGNWTTNPSINYSNTLLFKIWKGMAGIESEKDSYQSDLIDIGRQFLGDYFSILRDSFSIGYQQRDINLLHRYGQQMIELLDDLDELVSLDRNLSLNNWISSAKKFGKNKGEQKYYEQNARVLLTTWAGKNQSLNDYANRSWSGLVSSYYKKRWQMFIEQVTKDVAKGAPFDEKAFLEKVTNFEWNWTKENLFQSFDSNKDALSICKKLIRKYESKILTVSK